MCRSIEEMLNKEKERIARRMIAANKLKCEEIAEYSDLSIEEVRKLESEVRGKQ